MIEDIIARLKNYIIIHRFVKFNKEIFKKNKNNTDSKILIEFNAFNYTHCYRSIIASYMSRKYPSNLVAFNNYKLTTHDLKVPFLQKLKWNLGKLLKLKNFKIYNSFGVKEFISPTVSPKHSLLAKKILNKILSKIDFKKDILKIKIDNILIGDLIYDGYIKFFSLDTLDINSTRFKKYLLEFILIYLFWKDYLNKNNVKCILGVHGVYAYGIIYRIAFNKKIEVFTNMAGRVFRLNKKDQFNYDEYK